MLTVNLRTLKRRAADVMTAPACGRTISWILHDQIPTHGCTINTASPHISPDTKAQLFWGTYERTEIRFSLRYLRNDLDVIELGSSIGMIASVLARRLQPHRRMVCVEAHPGLAAVVAANVRKNAPAARFIVVNKAIDYESVGGHSQLLPSGWSHSGKLSKQEGGISVRSTTLSELLHDEGIAEYLLVADIEGAEAGLLLEDPQALLGCRQMVIELHTTIFRGKRITAEEMSRVLAEKHAFTLLDNYGAVYAFGRSASLLERSPASAPAVQNP